MDTNNSSDHQPIEAPSGLDLHPQPQKAVRISRRASMAIISVIVLLLLGFAYGGYRRTLTNQAAARDAGLPRNVTPATQAGTEFMQATPAGTVPMTRIHGDELHPPDTSPSYATASCGTDPKTGQPYRFNPQTGQLCDSRRASACRRLSARTGGDSGAHEYPQFFGVIVWNRKRGASGALWIR